MNNTVGIHKLKAHLSRHLRRVRSGTRLVVTDRGRAIASIQPTPDDVDWAHAWAAAGGAQWNGGKPEGATPPVQVKRGTAVSDAVLEDRRDAVSGYEQSQVNRAARLSARALRAVRR